MLHTAANPMHVSNTAPTPYVSHITSTPYMCHTLPQPHTCVKHCSNPYMCHTLPQTHTCVTHYPNPIHVSHTASSRQLVISRAETTLGPRQNRYHCGLQDRNLLRREDSHCKESHSMGFQGRKLPEGSCGLNDLTPLNHEPDHITVKRGPRLS